VGADYFKCRCGRFERTLHASSHEAALKWFRLAMAAVANTELVEGATSVDIKGPIRSRHEGMLYEFDRETGEVLRRVDLRPKRGR
jgi:hypothetical protein